MPDKTEKTPTNSNALRAQVDSILNKRRERLGDR
jgi:hypothetical protein